MAVTWDLELDQVGVGVTQTTGIIVSAFGLTTLTQSTDYRIRVRAVDTTNGVIVYSPWTAWLDFTTQAIPTDITVNLDLLTNTQSIHAVTATVPPVVVITDTYDLRVTEVGVGSNVITEINESNYALTGLTGGSDYELEVRLVRSVDGVIYYSLWSDPVTFTAGQALPEPITVNLGSLVNSQTLDSLTVTVDPIPEPISVDLGSLTNNQTLSNLTVTVSDAPTPITVNLDELTNSQTLNALTVIITEPSEEVPATHWRVTVTDLSDSSVVIDQITFTSDFNLTGLTTNKNYRVTVIGISQQAGVSDPVTFDFQTLLESIVYYTTTITTSEQPLDIFRVTVGHFYDAQSGVLTLSGSATDNIASMSGAFDSKNIVFQLSGSTWQSYYYRGALVMRMPDELDGTFEIKLDANGTTGLGV